MDKTQKQPDQGQQEEQKDQDQPVYHDIDQTEMTEDEEKTSEEETK